MFQLTASERKAIVFILGLLFLGISLHLLLRIRSFKKFFYQDMLPTAGQPIQKRTEKICLNKASSDELTAVPGIGPALAERIVSYREEHGPFQTVDDLVRVKGIGPKKMEQIKGAVSIQ